MSHQGPVDLEPNLKVPVPASFNVWFDHERVATLAMIWHGLWYLCTNHVHCLTTCQSKFSFTRGFNHDNCRRRRQSVCRAMVDCSCVGRWEVGRLQQNYHQKIKLVWEATTTANGNFVPAPPGQSLFFQTCDRMDFDPLHHPSYCPVRDNVTGRAKLTMCLSPMTLSSST